MGTEDEAYARRLQIKSGARWKRVLNVQAPYRWNLRRHALGRTLDIGCGIGRNLADLATDSVGVDHNPTSVGLAQAAGLRAFTVDDFLASLEARPESFDSLLVAHVIEHLSPEDGLGVMRQYTPFLRPGGLCLFICPQERGYASDPTHIRWTTGDDLSALARDLGLEPQSPTSFPLPRWAGRFFTYNEFNVVARKPWGWRPPTSGR